MKNFIILISKGRNLLKTLVYLKFYNIYIKENLSYTRKLIYKTNYKYLYIIIIKNIDIIFYINNNLVDFIFFGKDLLLEEKINIFYKFYNLNFINFYISLISNLKLFKIFNLKKIYLATKYLNISKYYFNYLNIINISFLKINSSSELLINMNKSDLIIDIISSGKTIIENNLYNLFNLIKLNNILLLNLNLIYKKIFINFFYKKFIYNIFNVIFYI
ncbi:ATP phosphoribosyltransferase [Candidatus Nasuia deltocephalinicola]|nr:ATP phosphoribosyltransferase [Candidatus Nasuia deltocephalinicola]